MSKETRGQLVQFIEKDGNAQKAIAREIKQVPEFVRYRKVFLEYVNDDMTPKMLDGKKVVGLKNASLLKLIGYVD